MEAFYSVAYSKAGKIHLNAEWSPVVKGSGRLGIKSVP